VLGELEIQLVTRREKERYAGAKQDWLDIYANLVDKIGFEERVCQLAAADHTDAFAWLFLETLQKRNGIVGDYFDVSVRRRLEAARKDVVLCAGIRAGPQFERDFVRLAPHDDGVDGLPVLGADRGDFVGPRKPVGAVIRACNEVVETVCHPKGDDAHRLTSVGENRAQADEKGAKSWADRRRERVQRNSGGEGEPEYRTDHDFDAPLTLYPSTPLSEAYGARGRESTAKQRSKDERSLTEGSANHRAEHGAGATNQPSAEKEQQDLPGPLCR